MNLGMGELIVIGIVVLLVFGASRLPEVGRSLGDAVNQFKRGLSGEKEEKSEESKGKKSDKK